MRLEERFNADIATLRQQVKRLETQVEEKDKLLNKKEEQVSPLEEEIKLKSDEIAQTLQAGKDIENALLNCKATFVQGQEEVNLH